MLAEKSSGIKEVTVELIQDFVVVKSMESRNRLHEFKSQDSQLLAVHFRKLKYLLSLISSATK